MDFESRLRAAATAYVHFAIHETAFTELMFAAKVAGRPSVLHEASVSLYAVAADLIGQGQQEGALPPGDPDRLRLLLVSTLQGIASLVITGRAPAGQLDALIADAAALFTRPRWGSGSSPSYGGRSPRPQSAIGSDPHSVLDATDRTLVSSAPPSGMTELIGVRGSRVVGLAATE